MSISYEAGEDFYKNWIIEETTFKKENQAKFETIFSLGNGYMGLRASTEETYPKERRGFYIAGIFDEFSGEVTEMPNLPDWIRTEIYINGEQFKLDKGRIFEYSRKLNLKNGLLTRDLHWESPRGEMIEFSFERFISLNNLHTCVSKIEIKPLNFSGEIKLISGFDGRVSNSGTQHLKEGEKRLIEDYIVYQPETQQSEIKMSFGLHHDFYKNQEKFEPQKDFKAERRMIKRVYGFNLKQKEKATIIKRLSAFTNKDKDFREDEDLEDKMIDNLIDIRDTAYKELKDDHIQKWRSVWEESDLKISGSDFDQLALRFAIFHLIQMTPAHDDRISIAAKGLSGEGYKGHVFWDTEVFILPFFIYTYPEIARKLLKYRYHTLDGARQKAQNNGYQGAMFAWESAENGQETTPKYGSVDILTGEEIRIWCGEIEQHITVDIQYAFDQYFQATGDIEFMKEYGFEVFLASSRFWASRLEYNQDQDRYEINNVMGPDEYKEHIDNNAFINYMVHWQFEKALSYIEYFKKEDKTYLKEIKGRLNLKEEEINDWDKKRDNIFLPQPDDNNIIPQFEGFQDLKEIDLTEYKQGDVGNIFDDLGWEEITESKVSKQADVVMLTYLLEEVFDEETIKANFDYYEPLTLHDSSLSPGIHATVAAKLGENAKAYNLFQRAARIDLGRNMTSSDAGLHAASLGALWQSVVFGFAGLRLKGDVLQIDPHLPVRWNMVCFNINVKQNKYKFSITQENIKIEAINIKEIIPIQVNNQVYKIEDSQKIKY